MYPIAHKGGTSRTSPRREYTAVVERQEVLANTLALGLHSLGACEPWDRDCARRWCVVQNAERWECHRLSSDPKGAERVYSMSDGGYIEYVLEAQGVPLFDEASIAQSGPFAAAWWWLLRVREAVRPTSNAPRIEASTPS